MPNRSKATPAKSSSTKAASSSGSASSSGRARSAASSARSELIKMLKDDHKRVKQSYQEFEKLHERGDDAGCQRIVERVLAELDVHTAIEEELLYPACHEALPKEEDLLQEAEVEHESAHVLMDQLRTLGPSDEKYAARFTVLCEYVMHHVKEEEGELFPKLSRAKIDWESLAQQAVERREELMASMPALAESDDEGDADMAADGQQPAPVRVRSAQAASRGRSAAR